MTYKLQFNRNALKEWRKLDSSIQKQLTKKLTERLETPIVAADKIRGFESVYKIKLRSAGYRLIYQVKDDKLIVLVLSVGKRDKGEVYDGLENRIEAQEN